nr:ATP-binding protein [Conexibacter arvalis]
MTLPAAADSVPRARRAVVELARRLGAREGTVADVALAVSEACTNVVLHAYRGHDEPGVLHVEADGRDGMLEVVVSDEGGGLQPREDSPGLGMGMALMAAVASGLQLDHDGAATRVHLSFDLGVAASADGPESGARAAGEAVADRD